MTPQPADPASLTPHETLDSLIRAFDGQVEGYESLLALTREASARIRKGSLVELQTILDSKQAQIDRLAEQDRLLAPVRLRWMTAREELSEEEKAPLQDRVNRLARLMEAVIELEKQNEAALRLTSSGVNTELLETTQKRAAFSAYQAASEMEPRFLDRKK